jgi:hypothetical protein
MMPRMSETHPTVTHGSDPQVSDMPGAPGDQPRLLRLGGGLGVAACVVGLAILLAACAGMDAVFKMSFIPVGLGLVGFVLSLVGAVTEKQKIREDTHVLGALFATCLGIIGGLFEMAVWLNWQTFYKS